jgi:N-acetylmuramoyl-L-alanine amidase CwlA
MRKHILIVMTAILLLTLSIVALAAEPHVGTWKLNVAKSTYNPGPPPKSTTLKIEAQESGFKWTFDIVEADGKATHVEWSGKHDGKDYSFKGNADFDTAATKKIDANTLESVVKKGGKVAGTGREVVSKDGKTLTFTQKLKNAQGRDTNDTLVYDKQ